MARLATTTTEGDRCQKWTGGVGAHLDVSRVTKVIISDRHQRGEFTTATATESFSLPTDFPFITAAHDSI